MFQASVRAFIGVEQVFKDLNRTPFARERLRQPSCVRTGCCLFEFLPQAFQVGIHSFASVQ